MEDEYSLKAVKYVYAYMSAAVVSSLALAMACFEDVILTHAEF